MTRNMKQWIESLTDAIRREYKVTTPVDFNMLVEKLGGEIISSDSWEDPEASIVKTGDSSFRILIQEDKPENRKRFSKAHELGHLFVHMGYKLDEKLWASMPVGAKYPRFGNSEEEREAHYFAAALLMPKDEFLRKCYEVTNEERKCDVQTISEHFGVSFDAALNRGRDLGIFSW